jgi:hypothetical protein
MLMELLLDSLHILLVDIRLSLKHLLCLQQPCKHLF